MNVECSKQPPVIESQAFCGRNISNVVNSNNCILPNLNVNNEHIEVKIRSDVIFVVTVAFL